MTAAFLLVLTSLLACGPKAPPQAAAAPPLPVEAAPPPPPPPAPPPPSAPAQSVESEGMKLSWVVEGDRLRCTMSAPGAGWVRVGFNNVRSQHLANMILGWVDASGAHVEDRYANDPPFIEPDVQLGGTADVELIRGTEEAGRTTIEFTIPLNSGDAYDLTLSSGQTVYFILGYGSDDDPKSIAVVRTAVEATL